MIKALFTLIVEIIFPMRKYRKTFFSIFGGFIILRILFLAEDATLNFLYRKIYSNGYDFYPPYAYILIALGLGLWIPTYQIVFRSAKYNILFHSYRVVGVISATWFTLLFLFILLYREEVIDHFIRESLQEYLNFRIAQILAIPVAIMMAMALYKLRSIKPLQYGLIELAFSLFGLLFNLSKLSRPYLNIDGIIEILHGGQFWSIVFASIYIFIRGLDNIKKGLEAGPVRNDPTLIAWNTRWERLFPKVAK
jgi:hypothetical protein